jgi:hypothetical protein
MKTYELLEARKNPELNPKISTNDVLHAYVDKFGKNCFISFTSVDKLGINPRSDYDTPIGIYAYPGTYAARIMGAHRPASALPFAGSSPFATLFTASNGLVDLGTFTTADYDKAISDLKKAYNNRIKLIDQAAEWSSTAARVQTPGGLFWALTMRFAQSFVPHSAAIVWNEVFRKIGVNGCIDSKGEGIIHPNEPTQAVFFKKPGVIENEKRVLNKYAPERVQARIKTGQEAHADVVALGKLRKEDFIEYLKELYRNGNFERLTQLELDNLSLETVFTKIYTFSPDEVQAGLAYPASSVAEDLIKVGTRFTNNLRGKRWKAFETLVFNAPSAEIGIRYSQSRKPVLRDPAFEKRIISSVYDPAKNDLTYEQATSYAIMYAASVIKKRWAEAEKAIIHTLEQRQNDPTVDDEDDSEIVYTYARQVVHGAWPEAEHLITDDIGKRLYNRFVTNNTAK